jgi:hypothetical protein
MWIEPRYMVSTTAANTRSAIDSAVGVGVGVVIAMGRSVGLARLPLVSGPS